MEVVTKSILILLFQWFALMFEIILTKINEIWNKFFLGMWISVFSQISAPTRRYFGGGASANSLSLLFVNHFVAGSAIGSGQSGQVVVCLETSKCECEYTILRQDFLNIICNTQEWNCNINLCSYILFFTSNTLKNYNITRKDYT